MSAFIENVYIKDGEYTKTIYTMIKEQRYIETIKVLLNLVDSYPNVCIVICNNEFFNLRNFISAKKFF